MTQVRLSFFSNTIHFFLKLLNVKSFMYRWAKSFETGKGRKLKVANVPGWIRRNADVIEGKVQGRNVITIVPKKRKGNIHIINFPGGAYGLEANSLNWYLNKQIVQQTGFKLSMIQYPLAPESYYKEAFDMALEAYELVCKEDEEIYIMGDSAGGGFSLAFTHLLNENPNLKFPTKLVLISPWLDMTDTNRPSDELESRDLILSHKAAVIASSYWAKGTEKSHYLLSPKNGNLSKLPKVGLWMGTHEIFYDDAIEFDKNLSRANIPHQFIIGQRLQHVYPMWPTKEGRKGASEIIHFLSN